MKQEKIWVSFPLPAGTTILLGFASSRETMRPLLFSLFRTLTLEKCTNFLVAGSLTLTARQAIYWGCLGMPASLQSCNHFYQSTVP